jgi:transposase
MAVEGATTSRVFETYLERLLAPALRPGQVVVMDNLGAHRPKRVRELIEERGCELVYLPAYSPDLNPIEEALSKIKHILRTTSARTKDALIEAMGLALGAVSARDAGGFFVSCGYRTPAQQLWKTLWEIEECAFGGGEVEISKEVRRWLGQNNRRVKNSGCGVRITSCLLPKQSPWLNAI